ncbi:hypothetical protein GGR50DRAFT_393656 [Xylaria sp. CBS 124048]|nr:hypothetical protein GGR50DRAFT_393656 [Xylaria sp. CBS 124048]
MSNPTPVTTIVPFATLPACAEKCGHLFDANGACVPPVNPATDEKSWDSCFCANSLLQPLKTSPLVAGPNDVCMGNCDAPGLSSIQNWFTSLCNDVAASTTGTPSPTSSSNGSGDTSKSGGDWASTHVNWIVFIVVVVVAIIGIWVGACVWRRKYLKKKDRLHELGKGLPSTVAVNAQGNFVTTDPQNGANMNGSDMLMSGSGIGHEKPEKRSIWGRRS